jgi:hypothetical protein
MMTRDEIEQLLYSMLPAGWLQTQGGGVIAALSAVAERLFQAVQNLSNGLTPGLAYKGSYATGTIKVTITQAGGIHAGSIFRDQHGEDVIVTEDKNFDGAGEYVISVKSKRQSFQANLHAGTVLMPVYLPQAVTRTVPNPLPFEAVLGGVVVSMSGGVAPALEELAEQRSITISPSEDIAMTRWRFTHLDKVITPSTIREIIKTYFTDGQLIEIWEVASFCDYAYCDWTQIYSMATNAFIVRLSKEIDSDPDVVSKVAAMAADIDARRAGGIYWSIEEV